MTPEEQAQKEQEAAAKALLAVRKSQLEGFEKANSNKSSWYIFTAILAIVLLAGTIAMMVMHCHSCKDSRSCSVPACMPMSHNCSMHNCGMAMCMPMPCDGNMPCGEHKKDCCDKMPPHGYSIQADSNKCAHDSSKCCMEDCQQMPMPCIVYMPGGNNSRCARTPCIVYLAAAIIILLVIVVIIALILSGKSNKSADKYRDQVIVLHDLETAIALAMGLSDKTEKIISQLKTEVDEGTKTTTGTGENKTITEHTPKITRTTPTEITTKEPERTNAIREIIEKLLDRCS